MNFVKTKMIPENYTIYINLSQVRIIVIKEKIARVFFEGHRGDDYIDVLPVKNLDLHITGKK